MEILYMAMGGALVLVGNVVGAALATMSIKKEK
jgi:hypothetical protein